MGNNIYTLLLSYYSINNHKSYESHKTEIKDENDTTYIFTEQTDRKEDTELTSLLEDTKDTSQTSLFSE